MHRPTTLVAGCWSLLVMVVVPLLLRAVCVCVGGWGVCEGGGEGGHLLFCRHTVGLGGIGRQPELLPPPLCFLRNRRGGA